MGTWLSIFPNWQTFAGQFLALGLVIGSYVIAQYMRVWRPRQRGEQPARIADAPPEPSDRPRRAAPGQRARLSVKLPREHRLAG